jgi:hypothetical protein
MCRVRLGVDAFWHFRHHFIAVALLSSTLVSLVTAGPETSKTTARGFKIINYSGSRIELYWVHVSDLYLWEFREQSMHYQSIPTSCWFLTLFTSSDPLSPRCSLTPERVV